MWSKHVIVSMLLAVVLPSSAEPDDRRLSVNPGGPMIPACPTVTTTAKVCSTCITHPCVSLSTIVNPGICPSHVPTVTKRFPCSKSVCPGGCSTQYVLPWTASTTTTPFTTPCPTVTQKLGDCSTCVRPMCEAISVIRPVCGCPAEVPTVTTSYSCGGPCPGGCAGTTYVYDTATPTCTA